ncbi:MAG TPA: LysR substrate-binding domain-containing protein [Opitutaceae bacterium]|nr:LysR substrate-binding domain-containing protein [Opitutaceae bacterium]
MELRHLRYFSCVAECLNFTRASEKLRVAQPALSRQIRALEDELGTQLFDRNRQRVILTDAGRLLFAHAQKILAQVDLATLAVRDVANGAEGELRIGQDWRLPAVLASQAIAEYRRRFPRVEVIVRDLPMSEQLSALNAHKIHLGFIATDLVGPDPHLASQPVLHSELVAIVPLDHPLARRPAAKLAELRDSEWISIDTPDAGYRTFLLQVCRNAGFTPRFSRALATQAPALVGLVAAGMGIALVPRLILPPTPLPIAVLATDCDPLEIHAVWHRDGISPLLRNFVAILGELPR